ncbi:MAG: VOC family protein [Pseudomonadota bacterium]|nr:VOC family protein [Pseudomonadota bacterium]
MTAKLGAARPNVTLHHVGIWVKDFNMMVGLYQRLFGFHISDQGNYDPERRVAFLTSDPDSHHTFVIGEGRKEDTETTINQISFRAQDLAAIRAFWETVEAEDLLTHYEARTHGNSWSLYFWDPEGNRVEIFTNTPWHVAQPFSKLVDFNLSDEEILAMTEKLVKTDKTWRPLGDWRNDTAKALNEEK